MEEGLRALPPASGPALDPILIRSFDDRIKGKHLGREVFAYRT